MSNAASHLRRVKGEFENRGIRNEVQITEHVAFLLLPEVRDRWEEIRALGGVNGEPLLQQIHNDLQAKYVGLRMPQPPPVRQWGSERLNELLTYLQDAFNASPHNASWGAFFQREIRFELLKGSSGSQYPTPHHIADLMATLALTGLNIADVFDPTAGSGGLLAACRAYPYAVGLTGCDFDPQWAGIGSTNLLLNGAEDASLHVGSALGYASSYANHFSVVLMNPPFGGSRSAQEIEQSVGREFGRSNATVLTALALHCLQPGGRAAVLVPSGALFGGGGEANLRQALATHNLEAVVRLPKGSFQPYSQVGANLLVFQKRPDRAEPPTQPVWFLAPEGDGYDPGMGRDLTADPAPATNGLPRVRDLILQTRAKQWSDRLSLATGTVQTTRQEDAKGLSGVAVRVVDGAERVRWSAAFFAEGLWVAAANPSNQFLGWLFEPLTGTARHAFPALPDDAPRQSWTDLVANAAWQAGAPTEWQGEVDEITLSVNAQGGLTLSKPTFTFTAAVQDGVRACLLNERGQPLTPWLGCDHADLIKTLDAEADKNKLKARPIRDGQGNRCGWLIDLTANGEGEETQSAVLLLAAEEQVAAFTEDSRFYLTVDNGWLAFVPNTATPFAMRLGQPVTLPDNVRVDGLAVGPALDGRNHHLFGLWVHRSAFVDADGRVGDLRPVRFFPEPETVAVDSPADLLVNIRRNQEMLTERVDVLLRALHKQTVPNHRAVEIPDWYQHLLGDKQRRFWQIVAGRQSNGRPAHFTIEHVKQWCAEESSLGYQEDDVQQQLDLLIRLGLIQQVHVKGEAQEGAYDENLYRALTQGDILPEGRS